HMRRQDGHVVLVFEQHQRGVPVRQLLQAGAEEDAERGGPGDEREGAVGDPLGEGGGPDIKIAGRGHAEHGWRVLGCAVTIWANAAANTSAWTASRTASRSASSAAASSASAAAAPASRPARKRAAAGASGRRPAPASARQTAKRRGAALSSMAAKRA